MQLQIEKAGRYLWLVLKFGEQELDILKFPNKYS